MRKLFLTAALLPCFQFMFAQQIIRWPGDANNNGIVNHFDIMHVGRAFGQIGPPDTSSGTFSPDTLSAWQLSFPNGLNMGFADCDGNGIVNEADTGKISQFYGLTHQPLFPDSVFNGTNIHPQLLIGPQADTVVQGTTISIPVVVGSPNLGVFALHGLAFSVFYDTAYVQESTVSFTPEVQWLGQNMGIMRPLIHSIRNFPLEGKMEICLSRTDTSDVSGWGEIGSVIFVMEDNLIGSPLGNQTDLTIDKIQALDYDMNPVLLYPIVTTLHISGIWRVGNFQFETMPNPVDHWLEIKSNGILIYQV